MKWLTQKEIKERSKTAEGALDVSIEHHEQVHEAGRNEYFRAKKKGFVDVHGGYCGLCQHFKHDHKSCLLFEDYVDESTNCACCKEWRNLAFTTEATFNRTTQVLLNRLYLERGKLRGKCKPKPEPKQEIRHGHYGFDENGTKFVVTAQSDNPKAFFENGAGQIDVNGPNNDEPNKYDYTILGNIDDDLEAMKEDVTEVVFDVFSNRFAISKNIEMRHAPIYLAGTWFPLDEAEKICLQLRKMLATAQRQKDC